MATSKCLFACEFSHDRPHSCPDHGHGCVELVYFSGCSGYVKQDGIKLKYKTGDFLVYQPRQIHADEQSSRGTQLCVGVVGCGAEKLKPGMYRANERIREVFDKIRVEISRSHPLKAERLDILVGWLTLEIRSLLNDKTEPETEVLPYHVAALKKTIDSRFAEPLQIKKLTGQLFVHPDYLRHLFRRTVGESPIGYLINRRLDAAKELLSSTEMPIFQIAETVGFSSTYYFCRLFKKHNRITPTDYRQMQLASSAKNIDS